MKLTVFIIDDTFLITLFNKETPRENHTCNKKGMCSAQG